MSSNATSTSRPQGSDPPDTSTTRKPTSSTANPPTTAPPTDSTTSDPTTSPTSTPSTSKPTTTPPSTSQPPTSSENTPTKSSSDPPPSSSTPPPSSSKSTPTPTDGQTSTVFTTVTSPGHTSPGDATSTPSTTSSGPALNPSGGSNGKLSDQGRIAVAVVVPIAAVALLVLAGIYFWRKRKQRRDAAEQARKEVEDYGYNPNADPTIPNVGAGGGPFEMVKEDAGSGYRGWGSTTLASSTGRKASTTMSGGPAGAAYSDTPSPTRGNISDTRSGEPLMRDGSHSPEGEILGAMGPSAAANRADVHRGPSNASSSYSAAARSDGSGEGAVGYGGGASYYDQYGNSNPYTDRPGPTEGGGQQPVIRDVSARRNTRIENSGHYQQQTAGISQNF